MTTTTILTMERQPFARWNNQDPPYDNGFTGLITYRRPDGTRLCEREFLNDQTWGACRYFDSEGSYVGQEWYGTPGYDGHNLGDASGGVDVFSAEVDTEEYHRIRREYNQNFDTYERTRNRFVGGGGGFGYKGVDVCHRENGTSIAEREWYGGTAFGCCRYYNEEGKFVGQSLYGGHHNHFREGGRRMKNHLDITIDPWDSNCQWPRGPFLSTSTNQKKLEKCKTEFYHSRMPLLLQWINSVEPEDLLWNVDELVARAAEQEDVGEIPDDMDLQCDLVYVALREHVSQWCCNERLAAALDQLAVADDEPKRECDNFLEPSRGQAAAVAAPLKEEECDELREQQEQPKKERAGKAKMIHKVAGWWRSFKKD